MSFHFLLQGIFLTQVLKAWLLGSPALQADSLSLCHLGHLLQGIFPTRGSTRSPALQAESLPAEPPGKPKNTGVGSLSHLQWIFPTQESNGGLLPCRWILYQLSYQGSPKCRGPGQGTRIPHVVQCGQVNYVFLKKLYKPHNYPQKQQEGVPDSLYTPVSLAHNLASEPREQRGSLLPGNSSLIPGISIWNLCIVIHFFRLKRALICGSITSANFTDSSPGMNLLTLHHLESQSLGQRKTGGEHGARKMDGRYRDQSRTLHRSL